MRAEIDNNRELFENTFKEDMYSNYVFQYGDNQQRSTFGCITAMGKSIEKVFYNNLKSQPESDTGIIFFDKNFEYDYFAFIFDIRNQ